MKEASAIVNSPLEKQSAVFQAQKSFFNNQETKSYDFRKAQLLRLKEMIKANEQDIMSALAKDFGKPNFETYVTEIGFLYDEINYTLKHLKSWMKPKKVGTGLVHFPSKSKIIYEPKGVTLIIGPWNYPFQLLLAPVVASIAAGNTCIIKPPEETPHISNLVAKLFPQYFNEEFLAVIMGEGKVVVPELMQNHRFDHVFFTGSVPVGRIIAKMAAEQLVPATLELGGKSPAIIDEKTNLTVAARRITFGKLINAGQTCVAPDYLLINEKIKDAFVDELRATIMEFYGISPTESKDLAQIVNQKRYDKLKTYLKEGKIVFGGAFDDEKRKIEPTIIEGITEKDSLFQEEVFGPILPVFTYKTNEEALEFIQKNPDPLAFYIFTSNKKTENYFLDRVRFGGGSVNNTIVHLANPELPFGGVGNSGNGSYHGRAGFLAFSNEKSILKSGTWFDLRKKYPPFDQNSMKMIRFLMK
ncbi:aldehyde dehydrogenase [Marivirga tractuosa]|uniref:Aldehyde dehydrogenase n=1 Tax=Marivirga tractuosa (strain ATCC 23168 / DSM 4126 / NBRC 15989 / NCIMB 1408 / VKM B-1430 / H-43) TaxID=643867 RepID=E4TVW1_MARTH|nr:aldehyde dehydrogenase family protein [Marivirga tractuosa]ADR22209.1 Aldehyde Dehydrogenase [Marivirga tractuosa DSM 4126]BDD13324.1 aldehyde dehydrogenase [Marivirga tractuosa]